MRGHALLSLLWSGHGDAEPSTGTTFDSGRKDAWENLGRNLGRHLGTNLGRRRGVEASRKELANDESPGDLWQVRLTQLIGGRRPAVSSGRCQMACGAVSARQNLVSRAGGLTAGVIKAQGPRSK